MAAHLETGVNRLLLVEPILAMLADNALASTTDAACSPFEEARTKMTLKSGGAPIAVIWGYDVDKVILTPRNWSRVKRNGSLRIRSPGFSEEGFQWEYWNFAGVILSLSTATMGEQVSLANSTTQRLRKPSNPCRFQ
jgi:hypothetical protein